MSEASKTADKALAMLQAMSDGELVSPQQLARRMGINRTVAQRLLTTLLARGYIVRADGEYALSQRVATLADAVQRPLRAVVDPVVTELSQQLRETVVFQVLDGTETVVLQEAYWARDTALQVRHEIGSRSPAARTAGGLAILALLDDDRLGRHVDADLEEVRRRVAEARSAGYTITVDELQDGVSGLATGVQSAGRAVGSLAVLVPTPRLEELRAYRGALERAARSIEASLN